MSSVASPDQAARWAYAESEYSDPFLDPAEESPEDRIRVRFAATGWLPRGRSRRLLGAELAVPHPHGGSVRFVRVIPPHIDRLHHPKIHALPTKRLVPVEQPRPLDSLAKYASKGVQDREAQGRVRWRFTLQNAAKDLLPGERVCHCLRSLVGGSDGVDVWHIPKSSSGKLSGLQTCASVWSCPVCAARISEFRRRELADMVTRWRAQGGQVVMLTYTIPHSHRDELRDLVRRLAQLRRRAVSGSTAAKIRDQAGSIGSVRALEITYGANGWHPHVHELHFVAGWCDVDGFGRAMWNRWKASGDALQIALSYRAWHATACNDEIAEYVGKWGHEPKKPDQLWTVASELAKQVTKIGRSETSFTPLQLLAAHVMGDPFAGPTWAEYAQTMKGQRQLCFSNGLRAAVGLGEELTDEQVMEQRETEAVHLAHLNRDEWRAVVGNDCRGELLQLAAAADSVGVRGLVDQLSEMAAAVRRERAAIERRIRGDGEVSSV